ncbi:Coenzyme PQQ synthesis protein B [Sodalis praecaptivus]|uniref:pyrroloquinoline quinone biosynthesis protein PqqB n=1 Tax=Sodalis praecaptivus TaxID=1239307 RepID=UPI0027FF30D9|nr:pyrroloquinoline quinone biosynthesis protein PqqB [Sodalis praecaptivus]CAJ0994315.1 Coenzyme PQQ synthesis protein B [Sodalis praecaptivus]
MQIRILGTAAGGGFPQWNCNCRNCRRQRSGELNVPPRTQSSIAVSDNGRDWVVCNVSPDIAQQIAANPALRNDSVLRGTAIGAIILTDSQIDHCAGLLSLREGCPHDVWCTHEVYDDLTAGFPVFTLLQHWNGGLRHHALTPEQPFTVKVCPALRFTAIPLLSNAPPYSRYRDRPLPGHNIALLVEDSRSGKRLFYAPGLGEPTPALLAWMRHADCLLLDGTLWTDDEMQTAGVGTHRGQEMGHLALGGEQGLLAMFSEMPAERKIVIHINNTNPILDDASPERRRLMQQGIEVSWDGMHIEL